MFSPTTTNQDLHHFERLYKARFGVCSKPEYSLLISEFHLSPDDAVEFMEDLTAFLDQAVAEFQEDHRTRLSAPET
jgi:hypothetical protein